MSIQQLQDYVRRAAEIRGASIAISSDEESITFKKLEESSNKLARLYLEAGCRPGDRVAILSEKNIRSIVAIVAVLKLGAIYVPLDPESPPGRLDKILGSCEPAVIVVDERGSRLFPQLKIALAIGDHRVISVSRDESIELPYRALTFSDSVALSGRLLELYESNPAPAALLYTSGSTGEPKGVPVSHESIIAFVEWGVDHFQMGSQDRCSSHSPLFFDLSFFDIFGSIAAMAECLIVPANRNFMPGTLASFIRDEELTQWFSVPSALSYMTQAHAVVQNDFPALKRIIWCGDVLPAKTLKALTMLLPGKSFTNLYGPTETTIASSYFDVPAGSAPDTLPIGRGCPGENMIVLDEARKPVAVGDTGELYIGGVGLSEGYWRDQEKTSAAFVDYEDGTGVQTRLFKTGDLASVDKTGIVSFHGRNDTQIKSRGYRIELGEIETAITMIEGVTECTVVAVESEGFETRMICAAVVIADHELDIPELRVRLTYAVPAYMIPRHWVLLEKFPLLPNGKRDRQQIAGLFVKSELQVQVVSQLRT